MGDFFTAFQGESPFLQTLGRWGYNIYRHRDMIQLETHLLLSAIFPIYIGAHASLRRPPSAATPSKSAEDEDEDEIPVEATAIEGLQPSDAIMFPILAGITLALLYVLIKWLDDPSILSRIMGWYFSCLGVIGVGKLAADFLNMATTFIFPSVWSSSKETYHVVPLLSQQVSGPVGNSRLLKTRKNVEGKTNPFPGVLSSIKFSDSITKSLWQLRALLNNHWILRGYVHGLFSFKSNLKLNDVIGFVFGFFAIILYNIKGSWWLTNLIGFGFCYGTLQLTSPTTFWTGSLVLAGLFVYDITMVFYTPMMVTVATSLDVPIKLLFPGAGDRMSMLGLGDVVLPGIVMALSLRFDLYLHYLRKQSIMETTDPNGQTKIKVERAQYVEARGVWGERFWNRGVKREEVAAVKGARFSKVYFQASVVGYLIAMLVTLFVMQIYKHAQPALLYLVPGVLIAVWGTALARGELKLMWEYTEDGKWGFEQYDSVAEKKGTDNKQGENAIDNQDASGMTSGIDRQLKKKEDETVDTTDDSKEDKKKTREKERREKEKEEHAHHVFLFSLSEPVSSKLKKGTDRLQAKAGFEELEQGVGLQQR